MNWSTFWRVIVQPLIGLALAAACTFAVITVRDLEITAREHRSYIEANRRYSREYEAWRADVDAQIHSLEFDVYILCTNQRKLIAAAAIDLEPLTCVKPASPGQRERLIPMLPKAEPWGGLIGDRR